jgi:hypothetical protein
MADLIPRTNPSRRRKSCLLPSRSTFAITAHPFTPFALLRTSAGTLTLVEGSVALNAEILNEAGTAILSTGHAADLNTPVTVQNLSHAAAIAVHNEYQVGPSGGPYVGRMCTNKAGNTATFA